MTPAEQAKIDRAWLWEVSGIPEQQAEDYAVRLGRLPDQAVISIANYARQTGDRGPTRTLQLPSPDLLQVAPGPGLSSQGGQAMFDAARRSSVPTPPPSKTPISFADSPFPGRDPTLPTVRRDDLVASTQAVNSESPPPKQSHEDFIAQQVAGLSSPGGSLAAAREAVAEAKWAAMNYDPSNDYDGSLLKLITNNLNMTADNLRQQEQADRRATGGAAGPSPQALRLMELEAQQIEANLTGQFNGQPTFAAQQAQQGIAEREQQRQEALQARREAHFKSQWDQLMGSGQHFAPPGANYAGSDIPGVAAPSAELMYRAYGGEIPRGYGPPGPNMLSGLGAPPVGGQ